VKIARKGTPAPLKRDRTAIRAERPVFLASERGVFALHTRCPDAKNTVFGNRRRFL